MTPANGDPGDGGTGAGKLGSRQRLAIELLRIGIGVVWAVNLVFIVAPANQYFQTFSSVAQSFGESSVGGSGLANFVAANPVFFAWLIALVTGYLAVAFLLGITVRLACIIGAVFSAILLGTQVGNTFFFPGGTDVGPHPLYILVYLVLLLGAAGHAYSVEPRLTAARARRRALAEARPTRKPARVPAPPALWAAGITSRAVVAYFLAGVLIAFGVGFGLVAGLPAPPPAGANTPAATHYVNISVIVNQTNGWPQYAPANLTIPTGVVEFTITDTDSPMNWTGCPCPVSGTLGGYELLNGTQVKTVSSDNVAHSFAVPAWHLAVYSPGISVVQFKVDVINPGTFVWICDVPCGQGANPYTTPPMGSPGWMTGTITVVPG